LYISTENGRGSQTKSAPPKEVPKNVPVVSKSSAVAGTTNSCAINAANPKFDMVQDVKAVVEGALSQVVTTLKSSTELLIAATAENKAASQKKQQDNDDIVRLENERKRQNLQLENDETRRFSNMKRDREHRFDLEEMARDNESRRLTEDARRAMMLHSHQRAGHDMTLSNQSNMDSMQHSRDFQSRKLELTYSGSSNGYTLSLFFFSLSLSLSNIYIYEKY